MIDFAFWEGFRAGASVILAVDCVVLLAFVFATLRRR